MEKDGIEEYYCDACFSIDQFIQILSDRPFNNSWRFYLLSLFFPPTPHAELDQHSLRLYILLKIFLENFQLYRCWTPQNAMHLSYENQRAFGQILLYTFLLFTFFII